MSRRSKSKINTRVVSTNANRRLRYAPSITIKYKTSLSQFEDRRNYHPEGNYAPARSFNSTRHRLVLSPRTSIFGPSPSFSAFSNIPPASIVFSTPRKVLICVRRKIRKQVLHALNKTGRGGQRKPRYSEYSSISCR